jgi:hypothetical protein
MYQYEEMFMKSFRIFLFISTLLLMSAGAAWAGLHDAPYSQDFFNWPTDTLDWTKGGCGGYTTGHLAANSVSINATGRYIISPTIDGADSMRVWLKGNSTNDSGTFKIYAKQGTGDFTMIRNCVFGAAGDIRNNTWAEVVISLEAPFRNAQDVAFKFVYERKVVGNVALDDFSTHGVDVSPPTIVSATANGFTQVDVLFSEPVDLTTSQTVTNYVVDHAVGNPTTATRDATTLSLVHLTFATMAANTYLLTANNVQDLVGNACVNATGSFTVLPAAPPTISSVQALNNLFVDVKFSKAVEQTSAETLTNYVVNNGVGNPAAAVLDVNDSLVHLTFATIPNNSYTIAVDNVQDQAGTPETGQTAPFTVAVTVQPGTVVINEIMYDDAMSTDSEWVELHNTTSSPVDISGWVLIDAPQYPLSTTAEGGLLIPQGTVLGANGYVVVSRDSVPGIVPFVRCLQYRGSWILGNSGDNLALFTDSTTGTMVDGSLYLFYPDLSTANIGNSIEKCDQNTMWKAASNAWHESTNLFAASGRYIHCTPNASNSECVVDVTPPTILSASAISTTVVDVTFSEPVDSATASLPANFSVDHGMGTPLTAVRQTALQHVRLTYGAALVPNTYTLTVNNVADLNSNVILPNSQTQFVVSPPPAQLVFSEIMPNPAFSGNADSLGEWFEVYNPNATAIDMSGWILHDHPGSDTIEGPLVINPGQYLVFASNGDSATNGGVPVDYAYHYGTSGWGMSLSNTSDSLFITNANGAVSAMMAYGSSFPYAAGQSAQLRDLTWNQSVDTNWCRDAAGWPGAWNNDMGTPRQATQCFQILPPQTYTLCDIRQEDTCGVALHLHENVLVNGVVTYMDSCRMNAYIEANNCAVMIYGAAVRAIPTGSTRLMLVGDSVSVSGYLTQYYGLSEIAIYNGITPTVTFLAAGRPTPLPLTLSPAVVNTHVVSTIPEQYESRHVRLLNMTFVEGNGVNVFDDSTGASAGHVYAAVSGTDTVVYYVQRCDSVVGRVIPVGPVSITGLLGQHSGASCPRDTFQIQLGNANPFVAACSDPIHATVYRVNTDSVEVRWQAPVGQQCDCYKVYYADTQDFTVSNVAACLCNGETTLRVAYPPTVGKRFFRVTASAGCQ